MDEKEYDKILKNIEKEENYIQENGVLYKIKDENKFRVIRRFELEGIMYMIHDHELSVMVPPETVFKFRNCFRF
jgi:hypothetical protein